MRSAGRRWSGYGRVGAAGAGALLLCGLTTVGLAVAQAAPAGAQSTQAIAFGAPTGASCSGVGLSSGPSASFTYLGLPVFAWNGVLLLGLLEPHAIQAQGFLLGPSCGDFAHGSSQFGLPGSVSSSFSAGPNGAVGTTTTAAMNAANLLTSLLGQSAFAQTQTTQAADVTPQFFAGNQSVTITVTYKVLSATGGSGPGSPYVLEEAAGAALSYTSSSAAPACNGQPVTPDESGIFSGQAAGTYSAVAVFSCPAGQTLSDTEPIEVDFNTAQVGFFNDGAQPATYSGAIVAQPDSLTVTTAP